MYVCGYWRRRLFESHAQKQNRILKAVTEKA